VKVAQDEVLGQRSQRAIRPGRDDRRMLAIAEPRARPKAERFYRPLPRKLGLRDGLVFASFPSPAAAHPRQHKVLTFELKGFSRFPPT
jgi:hypothetical protein